VKRPERVWGIADGGASGGPPMAAWRLWLYAVLVILVLGVGLWLAVDRIFQVDEIQNLHMSWLLTQQDAKDYYNSAELYMIPLAALSRQCRTPVAFLLASRVVFFVLFVMTVGLLAWGISDRKKLEFIGATLIVLSAPIFWDYGFEVRHDNIVLLGLALLIGMFLRKTDGTIPRNLFWSGLLGGILLQCSLKSVVLWGPLLGYMICSSGRRRFTAGARASLSALAGLGGSLLLGLVVQGLQGSLSIYFEGLRDFVKTLSVGQIRFFDWDYLWRFIRNHPLIALSSAWFLVTCAVPVGRRWARGDIFRGDDRRAKEIFLLLVGVVFLAVNPTPFPYNYLFVALLAVPGVHYLVMRILTGPSRYVRLIAYGLIAFQALIWAIQLPRHMAYRNVDQKRIVEFLNDYTNPGDCVFDGVGLAIFRKGPARDWYLHSLSRPRYVAGDIPPVREILSSSACPLLVESYKWQYMLPEDLDFIRANYLVHGRYFWILGTEVLVASPGRHAFMAPKDGFYLISVRGDARPRRMSIDGTGINDAPVHLEKGRHVLDTDRALGTVRIEWVKGSGVQEIRVPSIVEPIFNNWY
jgi:hypothetical protein